MLSMACEVEEVSLYFLLAFVFIWYQLSLSNATFHRLSRFRICFSIPFGERVQLRTRKHSYSSHKWNEIIRSLSVGC